jgi:hypothetical protein
LHQPPWSFGFYSQTRGTRGTRVTPCVKVPGSSRVPILPVAEEQSRTCGCQSSIVEDQHQCPGMCHSGSPSARSFSSSPSPPRPFTQYPSPPRSLVCDGQTSPLRPRLVVSCCTCPPQSPSPTTNSFVKGTAVINTYTSPKIRKKEKLKIRLGSLTSNGIDSESLLLMMMPFKEQTHGWAEGWTDGYQYIYCLPQAGGRIRSQGNYYCLPQAGVLHSQNKVIKCADYDVTWT